MDFNWIEYLTLARFIEEQRTSGKNQSLRDNTPISNEAMARCITSRSYYAAFCYARNYAINRLGFVPSPPIDRHKDHERVREHFRKNNMPNIKLQLENLSLWRNKCDYDNHVQNIHLFPAGAIFTAQQVFNSLS
jgi:hypothetical protein